MKLMVSSYGAGAHNGEEEETSVLSYILGPHIFNEPCPCEITISDPTGVKAQKYIVDAEKDVAAAIADDGGSMTDETTEANEATADDMTLLPATPAVNDAYYFGFNESTIGAIKLNVSTAGVGTWTITWEYYNGAWTALSGVTDGTTGFTMAGENTISWTVPSDWATTTVNSQGPFYYVRGRVSAYTTINAQPLGQQVYYSIVWPGAAKVTIEDPDSTDVFFGRLLKIDSDAENRTLMFYCEDWLSQLDDEQIDYDFREDLDGSGLRESEIYPDYDDGDGLGIAPAYTSGATYYVYDRDMSWDADEFNGMNMILSDKMAGSIKVATGPYQETVTPSAAPMGVDSFTNDIGDLWTDDADVHTMTDTADFYVVYDFKSWVTDSSWHSSTTGARIHMKANGHEDHDIEVQIKQQTGPSYSTVGEIARTTTVGYEHYTFEIPEELLADMFDSDGIGSVKIDVTEPTGGTLYVYYIMLEVDVDTTGYSTAISISDTTSNRLTIGTDLTADATKVWHGLPYSIAREIYKHIDSAETPGTLITNGDVLQTLTCAATIEHTSGISTRQFKDVTRLDILKDVARQDKSEFYIALGGSTVTYKSTWNEGSPTAFTDATPTSLRMIQDYGRLFNEFNIYGMRIGDRELSSTKNDSTSIETFGITKSKVERNTGLVSEYDTAARGTALVAQHKDIQKILSATIAGLDSSYRLGTEVSVTSTFYNLSSAVYIVDSWEYDSTRHESMIRMHPRVSQTGLLRPEIIHGQRGASRFRRGDPEKYVPDPATNTVTND